MKANFIGYPEDNFRPTYGDIKWIHRLNQWLEDSDETLYPVGYRDDGSELMQLHQENCVIYINGIAEEMDCVAVNYDKDDEDTWTFFYRGAFEKIEGRFERVAEVLGHWATTVQSIYPQKQVVENYLTLSAGDIDEVPDDWL